MRKSVIHVLVFGSCLQALTLGQTGASMEKNIRIKAVPLPLNSVRLTGGPLKRAQDLDAQYLLELQPDRMLAYLRQRAGLEAKGQGYGGWDGGGGNLPDILWDIICPRSVICTRPRATRDSRNALIIS